MGAAPELSEGTGAVRTGTLDRRRQSPGRRSVCRAVGVEAGDGTPRNPGIQGFRGAIGTGGSARSQKLPLGGEPRWQHAGANLGSVPDRDGGLIGLPVVALTGDETR